MYFLLSFLLFVTSIAVCLVYSYQMVYAMILGYVLLAAAAMRRGSRGRSSRAAKTANGRTAVSAAERRARPRTRTPATANAVHRAAAPAGDAAAVARTAARTVRRAAADSRSARSDPSARKMRKIAKNRCAFPAFVIR